MVPKEMLYKAFGTTVCEPTIGMLKLTVSDQEHFLGRLNLEFRFSVLGFKGLGIEFQAGIRGWLVTTWCVVGTTGISVVQDS